MEKKCYLDFKEAAEFLLFYLLIYFFVFVIFNYFLGSVIERTCSSLWSMITEVISLSLLILLVKKKKELNIKEILQRNDKTGSIVFPVIFLIIGLIILEFKIDEYLEIILPTGEFFGRILEKALSGGILVFLNMVVIGPFVEELLFKGIILKGLIGNYPARRSIIYTAFLFGLFHLNPWQFTGATIWGLISGWWFVKTGSLFLCFFGHALNNLIVLILFKLRPVVILEGLPLWLIFLGGILFFTGFFRLRVLFEKQTAR